MSEIKGYINMPFHGESAYEIAVRYGYEGTEEDWVKEIGDMGKAYGFTWYADTDNVTSEKMGNCGKLSDCMTDDFAGAWFYVITSTSDAGTTAYDNTYKIDGANGFLSLRDYVVWTGERLVHIPAFEAKASALKNSDGRYSPKSGVDGLMSSTDKAYLSDLINAYWGKSKMPVFIDKGEGHMCNWCVETGIYEGGLKKDCGGHPPVINENHTSWLLMVFNHMATDHNSLNHNHRVQIAFDLINSKVYMRRGWISSNSWTDSWSEIGGMSEIEIGSVTEEKLSGEVQRKLNKQSVIFASDSETVALDEYVHEVVIRGSVDLKILLPENIYTGWRCVINLTEADEMVSFDVGTSDGSMFGIDAMWNLPTCGKTLVLVKLGGGDSPASYDMYEIDSITRLPI